MSASKHKLDSWRWITLMILLLLVVGTALIMAANERQRLLEMSKQHINDELELIGLTMRNALLRKDYASIERVITEWGKQHQGGSIVVLNVTTPDERKVAHYTREDPQRDTAYYTRRHISTSDGEVIMLVETIRDFSNEEQLVQELKQRFLFSSVGVALLIWICIQYLAHLTLRAYNRKIERLEMELSNYKQARKNTLLADPPFNGEPAT